MTQDDLKISREAVCIYKTLRTALCMEITSHNILVQRKANIMVLDDPGNAA